MFEERGSKSAPILAALFCAAALGLAPKAQAAVSYSVIGQPDLASGTLDSRCADANARFNPRDDGGPSGIAFDHTRRVFVSDYGGNRVLMFNLPTSGACPVADAVIGAGLSGPEAVAWDAQSATLFIADTLSHTVRGYKEQAGGSWAQQFVLGSIGTSGSATNRFFFPRGLAVDPAGRLFVADDDNNRVLIFNPPFTNGQSAADSIGGGADGGFAGVKALAMVGNTLFVADYFDDRVLRFTGPFTTPDQTYASTGTFTGISHPVDLSVHPDGSLLVTDQGNVRVARYADAAFAPSANLPASTFNDNLHAEPLGVASDRDGRIFVADFSAFRVLVRDEDAACHAPIDAAAIAAVGALYTDLCGRPARETQRVLIGQQLVSYEYGAKSDPTKWYRDWLKLEQGGYPLPKIMGAELSDLMNYPGHAPNQAALDELIAFGQAGGLVTLVWHPDRAAAGGFSTPMSTAQIQSMIDDGSAVGQAWQIQLDRAGAVLQKFADAGVPVLFRPLHEQNGNFFWWGHDGSSGAALRARQAAWVTMWRDLVTDLRQAKGLHNLLFLFGTNQVNFDGVTAPLTYYPGGGWADVVGIDLYDEELDLAGGGRGLRHYMALTGTGKPFGLPEFGQSFDQNGTGPGAETWDARTLTTRLRDTYPRAVFANAWYSSVVGGDAYVFALADVAHSMEMLGDPLIQADGDGSPGPDPYSFTGQDGAAADAMFISNTIVVSGLSAPATMHLSGNPGARYLLDGGAASAADVTVSNGDRVKLRMKSAHGVGEVHKAVLAIGEASDTWTITTGSDSAPAVFRFPAVTAVPGSVATSDAITLRAMNTPTALGLAGNATAMVSVNGAAFQAGGVAVNGGDTIRLQMIASPKAGAARYATVTIGGVHAKWMLAAAP